MVLLLHKNKCCEIHLFILSSYILHLCVNMAENYLMAIIIILYTKQCVSNVIFVSVKIVVEAVVVTVAVFMPDVIFTGTVTL